MRASTNTPKADADDDILCHTRCHFWAQFYPSYHDLLDNHPEYLCLLNIKFGPNIAIRSGGKLLQKDKRTTTAHSTIYFAIGFDLNWHMEMAVWPSY